MKQKGFLLLICLIVAAFLVGCGISLPKDEESVSPLSSVEASSCQTESAITASVEAVSAPQESKDILPDKTAAEKKALNIFLSNFSETGLDDYDNGVPDEYDLINFAFKHNMINNHKILIHTDQQMGIPADKANATIDKYMGLEVACATAVSSKGYGTWEYRDGAFWKMAAYGDRCDYFTIADTMIPRGDGTYTVTFNVFMPDDGDLVENTHYGLDTATAKQKHRLGHTGSAVVREKTYNGKETYELIWYHVS